MAKEAKTKKRGASLKQQPQSAVSGWLWLAAGVAVGLFIAFLVFLQGRTPDAVREDTVGKALPKQESGTSGKKEGSESFNYDFYKLLPNMEVVIPEEDAAVPPGKQVAPVTKPGNYLLQAGSFRRFEDADRQKANLALLGVSSKIVKVQVQDRETWHRVHVGPFSSLDELNETRELLTTKKIDTLLIRIKG